MSKTMLLIILGVLLFISAGCGKAPSKNKPVAAHPENNEKILVVCEGFNKDTVNGMIQGMLAAHYTFDNSRTVVDQEYSSKTGVKCLDFFFIKE